MKKISIDTNAYVSLMKGNSVVRKTIEEADSVFISVFVVAELLFGFKNGQRESENLALLKNFLKLPALFVWQTTGETARIYAEIAVVLKRKGKPIPTNDIWIAACAQETASSIITFDKHFLGIPSVRVWDQLQ